jgi:transposase-like protein
MSERAAPLYCPYCGDEDLRPNEASHGAWECHSCARVFSVKFIGLLSASFAAKPDQAFDKGVSTE